MNNNQVNQASQTETLSYDDLTDKISLATEYLRQLDYLISEAYKLVNKQPTIENYNLRTNLGIGVFIAQNALYDIDPNY